MSGHIDRHKAIEAIKSITSSMSVCVNSDECHGMQRMQRQAVIELTNLPSSELESFEWCDTCKEYDQEKHCCHRFSKIINQTVEEIRRTTAIGLWVKVHGFATPGGDPVWKCSNCGKGRHVFGVEHHSYGADIADNQWVACPNCGAIMIGERDG